MKNYTLTIFTCLLLSSSCFQNGSMRYSALACPAFSYSSPEDVQTGDQYTSLPENDFIDAVSSPVSTFAIDADGASYSNIRRFIMADHQLPPKGAVRTEELLNYFRMDYPYPSYADPIALNGEVSTCPWNNAHKLVRIGIKGRPLPDAELPPSNLVFLIDVSGSMGSPDRLDLLKKGFAMLVNELRPQDRIAIVTYAGDAMVALETTPGNEKQKILEGIDKLQSGGSTAGARGITEAYEIAEKNFIQNGNNRVILGTDGDFNVGLSNHDELVKLIEGKRDKGIFLTVLGVGRGNLNDAMMEQVADNGNGTYEYIDKEEQLKKVFIDDYYKFFTIARDVKVQVEFNAKLVESYRLVGYENRLLDSADFSDDKKDAGEIGADQDITALYEIKPRTHLNGPGSSTFTIHFRYTDPASYESKTLKLEIKDEGKGFDEASDYMKLSCCIASFSMLLCDSKHKGSSTYDHILNWMETIALNDDKGYRKEFSALVKKAKTLR